MYPSIAFFDSGQGGLTIWENVVQHSPQINTLYLGDNARCPYGNKSPETIVRYTEQAAKFLEAQNAKLLIIVCGTASSVATQHVQKSSNIPVIGIVEGLCEYAIDLLTDKSQPIAVLATRYTIRSERFQTELTTHGAQNVWARACPLFVPLIEEGISQGEIVNQACDLYLNDIPHNVKIVVLACTHYPRIVHAIGQYLTKKTGRPVILKGYDSDQLISHGFDAVTPRLDHGAQDFDVTPRLDRGAQGSQDPIFLIEASTPIIHRVQSFLSKSENTFENCETGKHRTLCTDSPTQFERVANYFTKLTLPKIEYVEITE